MSKLLTFEVTEVLCNSEQVILCNSEQVIPYRVSGVHNQKQCECPLRKTFKWKPHYVVTSQLTRWYTMQMNSLVSTLQKPSLKSASETDVS